MTFVNYSAQQRHCLDGVHFWGFSHNASVSEWSTLRGEGGTDRGWRKNVRDVLTVVLFGSLCEQLLDVLPILICAHLPGGALSIGGGGRRIGHLETESL